MVSPSAGVPEFEVIVATNFTACPTKDGLGEEVNARVVFAARTRSVSVARY